MFEALVCGTPLVSWPWEDSRVLFASGNDHLVTRNRVAMQRHRAMRLRTLNARCQAGAG